MRKDFTNIKIGTYEEFVALTEEIGFLPLSDNCIGFVSLSSEAGYTRAEQWHTDRPDDPWLWRVQIEQQRKAAYAKLFDKKPGFISAGWFPVFLAARRRHRSINQFYGDGLLSNYAKKIYSLFEHHEILAAHELKSLCEVGHESASRFESALTELQAGMFITCNGIKYKQNKMGEPYGWPSAAYSTVEAWAGAALVAEAQKLSPQEAEEQILERVFEVAPQSDIRKVRKFLNIK